MRDDDFGTVCIPGCKAIKESDSGKALLVEFPAPPGKGGKFSKPQGKRIFIPSSVIHDDSVVHAGSIGDVGDLVIAEWFAEKEGLE